MASAERLSAPYSAGRPASTKRDAGLSGGGSKSLLHPRQSEREKDRETEKEKTIPKRQQTRGEMDTKIYMHRRERNRGLTHIPGPRDRKKDQTSQKHALF